MPPANTSKRLQFAADAAFSRPARHDTRVGIVVLAAQLSGTALERHWN
jgi:hypothetical protein